LNFKTKPSFCEADFCIFCVPWCCVIGQPKRAYLRTRVIALGASDDETKNEIYLQVLLIVSWVRFLMGSLWFYSELILPAAVWPWNRLTL